MIWVNKQKTLKDLHHQVFEYLQQVICDWIGWKDPLSTYAPKSDSKVDLRRALPEFPYLPENWDEKNTFTQKDFMQLTPEERFHLCFKDIANNEIMNEESQTFQLS